MSGKLALGLAERTATVGVTAHNAYDGTSPCEALGIGVGTLTGLASMAADAIGVVRGKPAMPGRSFVAGYTFGEMAENICKDLTGEDEQATNPSYDQARQSAANATESNDDPEETAGPGDKPTSPEAETTSGNGDVRGPDPNPSCRGPNSIGGAL